MFAFVGPPAPAISSLHALPVTVCGAGWKATGYHYKVVGAPHWLASRGLLIGGCGEPEKEHWSSVDGGIGEHVLA